MRKNRDFSLKLFDRDLTTHYYFLAMTLRNASIEIQAQARGIDTRAILRVAMIQTLMQYEEAVGAYCLACQETNVADFTNRILKYRTKQVHDFYSRIDSLTEDELSNTLSFCSPSFWTPVPDSRTIKKKMKKSRELLREKLNRLREFWEEYHDFYNASKHGGRYWLSELRLKEKQEQYLGIQWLKRDKGIDTRLAEGDEIETQTAHLADTARSIMTVLHANRILVWSSVGKVDPTMYRYL